jgi:hypothetical protein
LDDDKGTLRVHIDGYWTVGDLAGFLQSLDELYSLRFLLDSLAEESTGGRSLLYNLAQFPPAREFLGRRISRSPRMFFDLFAAPPLPDPFSLDLPRVGRWLQPEERLIASRVQFASPGITDLTGLGQVIGHVKDFLLRIIELVSQRHIRRAQNEQSTIEAEKLRLENDRLRLENERVRIENARQLVGVAREAGYSEAETRQLVRLVDERQDRLIGFAMNGNIRGVEMLLVPARDD